MRFNPPPNWPASPPGWTPPPGWEPDPSWPAPPPGWQLWVSDGVGAYAAPGQAKPKRTQWIIGGIVAVLVIAGAGVGLFFGLKSSGDNAEDLIRAAAKDNAAAINSGDLAALKDLTCESEQGTLADLTEVQLAEMTKLFGELSIEILSIDITGDTAKVEGRTKFANESSLTETATYLFKKESGDWKECGTL